MDELSDIFQYDFLKHKPDPLHFKSAKANKDLQCIHDYNLKSLQDSHRLSIALAITLIFVFAILGNGISLFYNFRRNIRPIFRTCLISLACSDIVTVTFVFVAYVSQMASEYPAVWILGDILCSLIPFATTAALLVNSLTLVGIALDRYWAVVKFISGTWNPSAVFCTAWAVFVWGLAAGIASPLLTSFYLVEFFIIQTDRYNRSMEIDFKYAAICASDKETTKYYYTVVFHLIFAPVVIAFVWLNSIIAKEVWNKRRPIDTRPFDSSNCENTSISKRSAESTTMSAYMNGKLNQSLKDKGIPIAEQHSQVSTITTMTSTPTGSMSWLTRPSTPTLAPTHKLSKSCYSGGDGGGSTGSIGNRKSKTCREIRQMRMFKAVLALMVVFIVCRMPTWIYLLVKLYKVANTNLMFMLHFMFGLLSAVSCVLNPFLYTFLIETIQYSCRFFQYLKRIACFFKYKSTDSY